MNVEDYEKLILEILYKGFISDPPHRINNEDMESAFGTIDNVTYFKIAREKLIQEGLIYGKNVNFGNPHYFQITGDGLIYYEKKFINSDVKKEYSLLISKFLIFLRDLGDKKYDVNEYIGEIDNRYKQAKIPRNYINKILNDDYDYEMNDLKWSLLYFTSRFVSRHFMGISGIGIGKEYLSIHNPDTFCLNLEGYRFLNDSSTNEESQKVEKNHRNDFIKGILNTKECEYLDFKVMMYELFSEDIKRKWEQRKEFLKDVLSLINNKTYDNNPGKAYIIIGVDEENGRYNGIHKNIEFVEYQTLIQLINEYITPKPSINFEEYYITGKKGNTLIVHSKKEGYDRNLIIILTYIIGTVYEIKKDIGNPNINVPYYHVGTSFIRDDSYIRRLTHEDREQIMSLFDEELSDEFVFENYDEDFASEDIIEESPRVKIDIELIKRYTEILKTKKLSQDNIEKILNRIKNETRILSFYNPLDDTEVINSLIEFVKFSCNFIQDKNEQINKLIFLILYDLTSIPDIIPAIKKNCFNYLKKKFNEGNRYGYLIRLLNTCSYFKNLIEDINHAIDQNDIALLDTLINFDFNTPNIKSNKWEIIENLIDRKEIMTIEEDKILIGRIQNIIEKIEAIK